MPSRSSPWSRRGGPRAAGPGGRVAVELIEHSSKCILTVWDTGAGPPSAVVERLFEPFVTGKPEGVGMGLAAAREIAQAHGGGITWGRENERTWFRVVLPSAGSEEG